MGQKKWRAHWSCVILISLAGTIGRILGIKIWGQRKKYVVIWLLLLESRFYFYADAQELIQENASFRKVSLTASVNYFLYSKLRSKLGGGVLQTALGIVAEGPVAGTSWGLIEFSGHGLIFLGGFSYKFSENGHFFRAFGPENGGSQNGPKRSFFGVKM